jgi:hypothetical protein
MITGFYTENGRRMNSYPEKHKDVKNTGNFGK